PLPSLAAFWSGRLLVGSPVAQGRQLPGLLRAGRLGLGRAETSQRRAVEVAQEACQVRQEVENLGLVAAVDHPGEFRGRLDGRLVDLRVDVSGGDAGLDGRVEGVDERLRAVQVDVHARVLRLGTLLEAR